MYFVLYGSMFFKGDLSWGEVGFSPGDTRWVQPGHAYRPEFNGDAPMEITVIGTETPPAFVTSADEVPSPCAYQKLATSSHVFR